MNPTVSNTAAAVSRTYVGQQRGRAAAAGVLVIYFALLFAIGGYWQWRRLGMPFPEHTRPVAFPDFRHVTAAWDCTRRGLAVLPRNPCDGGAANWPQIWLWPSHLGLDESSTVPIAISLAVVFFVLAILALPRGASVAWGVIYGLAICSPAVMFGVDYGNIDIAVFSIVGGGALLLHRRRVGAVITGESLLFLASLLKLFPIVSIAALLRQRRRVARLGAIVIAVGFAIYFLADYGYLAQALRSTSQSDAVSYGMRRFTEWFVLGVNTISPRVAAGVNEHLTERAWDVAAAAVIAVVLVAFRRRLRARLPAAATRAEERDLNLFWVGASIYVSSYVVFRSWDYRLAFVLLTIPQLLRWASMKRPVAIITLLALFGAMWLDAPPTLLGISSLFEQHIFTPWNQLTSVTPFTGPLPPAVFAQLILFIGLLAGLIATAPFSARTDLAPATESRTGAAS